MFRMNECEFVCEVTDEVIGVKLLVGCIWGWGIMIPTPINN
jgi:hypothetical protein